MHGLRRLGWGEAGRATGRVGYLLAKQSCTVQGAAGGCKKRDGGTRMLRTMVTSAR